MSGDPTPIDANRLLAQASSLRALARSLVGSDAGDDVVHDAYLAALQRRTGIERPGAWLTGVVMRLAARWRRSDARRSSREQHAARAEPRRCLRTPRRRDHRVAAPWREARARVELAAVEILALEQPVPGVKVDAFTPELLEAEARQVWALHQAGVVRAVRFRADRHDAVLFLECESLEAAHAALATLPLVRERLIAFDLVPLRAYDGFARLFQKAPSR